MFKRMLQWLRRILTAGRANGEGALPDIILSAEMESAIARWADEYEGRPHWAGKDTKTLGLCASIAKELARLVTMEAEIQISGGHLAEYLQQQLLQVIDAMPNYVELGLALGGIVFKPYVSGDHIVVDAVQGDAFYPTAFDSSGRMTGAVFIDQYRRQNAIYTRVEQHTFQGSTHTVSNYAFVSSNPDSLGKPVELSVLPEWSDLRPNTVFRDVDRPLFGYFKTPFANRIDRNSPLGVSIYADAEQLLRDADEQYTRYLWEYEGGEFAVYAAEESLRPTEDGAPKMPKHQRRILRVLPVRDPDFYKEFAPELRDEAYKRGLNSILQRIEFSCGLAYGTLSDPQVVEKTAEEIRASKQRSYSTIKGVQKAVEVAIIDLVYAVDHIAAEYGLLDSVVRDNYELVFDWDDSIVNDPAERKQMFWQYVSAGKYPMWKYLVEFEGYGEEDAKALSDLPELSNPFGFEGGGSSAST